MKSSIKQLLGHSLAALDGEIGHVKDFYFDDRNWAVRYVIVDTGTWLPGRQVLVSPHAFGHLKASDKTLFVKLTRKQIEESPLIATHKPVSRQQEEEFYDYYGWPYYWLGDGLWGAGGFPALNEPKRPRTTPGSQTENPDIHLRSAQAVTGYQLKTTDGANGHVADFILDNGDWAISAIVIKTGHRLSGREVGLASGKVERISYEESTVYVKMTADEVEQCPPYHPEALVDHV